MDTHSIVCLLGVIFLGVAIVVTIVLVSRTFYVKQKKEVKQIVSETTTQVPASSPRTSGFLAVSGGSRGFVNLGPIYSDKIRTLVLEKAPRTIWEKDTRGSIFALRTKTSDGVVHSVQKGLPMPQGLPWNTVFTSSELSSELTFTQRDGTLVANEDAWPEESGRLLSVNEDDGTLIWTAQPELQLPGAALVAPAALAALA